jgi:hypothetical protein
MRHVGTVTIASAIISAVAVIGRRAAIVAVGFIGPAAIISRAAVVAAILGSGDGKPGADDPRERRRRGRAATAAAGR